MNRTQSPAARVYCVDLAKNKFQVNAWSADGARLNPTPTVGRGYTPDETRRNANAHPDAPRRNANVGRVGPTYDAPHRNARRPRRP